MSLILRITCGLILGFCLLALDVELWSWPCMGIIGAFVVAGATGAKPHHNP